MLRLLPLLGVALTSALSVVPTAPHLSFAAMRPHACAALTMGVKRKKQSNKQTGKGKGFAAAAATEAAAEVPAEATTEAAPVPQPDTDEPLRAPDADQIVAEQLQGSGPAPPKLTAADAASPAGIEPVFALESAELLTASMRIGSMAAPPSYDDVLRALLAVPDDPDALARFTQANRDLLDFRFLYRLTADKLLAGNQQQQARMAELDTARTRAVKACQTFDTPLFKQIADAESRLGSLLAMCMQGKTPTSADVVGVAGAGPQAVFAFWLVLLAAVAAWESKLSQPAVEAQARGKLGELEGIRAALEGDNALMATAGIAPLLSLAALPDMSAVTGRAASASDAASARSMLAEVESDPSEQLAIVRRLGCAYCQTQRHGFQAYNPLVQRLAALYDVLLHGRIMPLETPDIKSPPREVTSRMIQMANDADKILDEAGVTIPLFW